MAENGTAPGPLAGLRVLDLSHVQALCMLKVRTAVANDTLADDHAAAERWARRPFRPAA